MQEFNPSPQLQNCIFLVPSFLPLSVHVSVKATPILFSLAEIWKKKTDREKQRISLAKKMHCFCFIA